MDYLGTYYILHIKPNQNLIFDIKFKFSNELSQFVLPWQPKTSYNQRFHKNWHIQQKGHIRCKLPPSSMTKFEKFSTYFTQSISVIQIHK